MSLHTVIFLCYKESAKRIHQQEILSYVVRGRITPDTLIARNIDLGISRVRVAFNKILIDPQLPENGITDSIYALLSSENFLRSRGSLERKFLQLLTRSFY